MAETRPNKDAAKPGDMAESTTSAKPVTIVTQK